ncbi:hypothetical protein LTR94_036497, partial [Friedmanniomyces endolithicus]
RQARAGRGPARFHGRAALAVVDALRQPRRGAGVRRHRRQAARGGRLPRPGAGPAPDRHRPGRPAHAGHLARPGKPAAASGRSLAPGRPAHPPAGHDAAA